MYFVGPSGAEEYSEYIYLDSGRWEYLGTSMIDIDTALSPSSTNPVQNKAVTAAINQINDSAAAMNTAIQANADAIEDLNDTIGAINTALEGVL
jgi:hypothetical protein